MLVLARQMYEDVAVSDSLSKRRTTEMSVGPEQLFESAHRLLRDAVAELEGAVGGEDPVDRALPLVKRAAGMLEDCKRLRAEERATIRYDKPTE